MSQVYINECETNKSGFKVLDKKLMPSPPEEIIIRIGNKQEKIEYEAKHNTSGACSIDSHFHYIMKLLKDCDCVATRKTCYKYYKNNKISYKNKYIFMEYILDIHITGVHRENCCIINKDVRFNKCMTCMKFKNSKRYCKQVSCEKIEMNTIGNYSIKFIKPKYICNKIKHKQNERYNRKLNNEEHKLIEDQGYKTSYCTNHGLAQSRVINNIFKAGTLYNKNIILKCEFCNLLRNVKQPAEYYPGDKYESKITIKREHLHVMVDKNDSLEYSSDYNKRIGKYKVRGSNYIPRHKGPFLRGYACVVCDRLLQHYDLSLLRKEFVIKTYKHLNKTIKQKFNIN